MTRAVGIVGQLPRSGSGQTPGLPPGASARDAPRGAAVVLDGSPIVVEGGRLRGDGRAAADLSGGRGRREARLTPRPRREHAGPPPFWGQPVSPPHRRPVRRAGNVGRA